MKTQTPNKSCHRPLRNPLPSALPLISDPPGTPFSVEEGSTVIRPLTSEGLYRCGGPGSTRIRDRYEPTGETGTEDAGDVRCVHVPPNKNLK